MQYGYIFHGLAGTLAHIWGTGMCGITNDQDITKSKILYGLDIDDIRPDQIGIQGFVQHFLNGLMVVSKLALQVLYFVISEDGVLLWPIDAGIPIDPLVNERG